ncbi:MAG TPA: amino acid permease [Bryobacteraceae bacterium]|jgi:APA family basic amino acid/polyamine antiporter
MSQPAPVSPQATTEHHSFVRGLGLYDASMIVMGSMIGSGIFIVPADMARLIGSPGWLMVAWLITGVLTIAAALSFGELASMMPKAGGTYVFLREAYSPLWGFLYGWTCFTVIQTGTIAAVAVAFARFSSVLFPAIAEDHYLIAPVHVSSGYAFSLSTAQLVAVGIIALLTWANCRGLKYGKIVQNIFTSGKIAAVAGLVLVGILLGANAEAVKANFSHPWALGGFDPALGVPAASMFGLIVALGVAQSGSLFSADAWHDVTFIAPEVRDPHRNVARAMAIGCGSVIGLYLLANVAYLVTLPLSEIQHAPSDRVATATLEKIFPGYGPVIMAIAIMISTFGCTNGLVLAGARAYFAMARHGLFFKKAGELNQARVPGWSLAMQGVWAAILVLPRTYDVAAGKYGNLYSNLLDYVISAALIFYILTIGAVFRLRFTRPNAERPYKVTGYPVVPGLYIVVGSAVLAILFAYRPATTWPGLVIVLLGAVVYAVVGRKAVDSAAVER